MESSRALVSTEGLISSGNFQLVFEDLTVRNITFARTGEVLRFGHYLTNPTVVTNCSFSELSSASIVVEATSSLQPDLITEIEFQNFTLQSALNPQRATINMIRDGVMGFSNAVFQSVSSTNDNSGIFYLSNSAQAT